MTSNERTSYLKSVKKSFLENPTDELTKGFTIIDILYVLIDMNNPIAFLDEKEKGD